MLIILLLAQYSAAIDIDNYAGDETVLHHE
jgi:hypothetical protein